METELARRARAAWQAGVDRAVEIGVVDEVIEPARSRSAIAQAINDAVQLVGFRRGIHGNIPL